MRTKENSVNRTTSRHTIILTGFFKYRAEILRSIPIAALSSLYHPWFTRLGFAIARTTFTDYLPNYFYSSFRNVAFPEIALSPYFFEGRDDFPPAEQMMEYCRTEIFNKKEKVLKLTRDAPFSGWSTRILAKTPIPFSIEYVDYSFYPEGNGLFSMKIHLSEKNPGIDLISDFLNQARSLNGQIAIRKDESEQQFSMRDFINQRILISPEGRGLFFPLCATDFNNKLKAYITVELQDAHEVTAEDKKNLLYDLGTVSPIGSAGSDCILAPADEYRDSLMETNCLSVFNNWSSLSLFDTYTTLITSPSKGFGVFEISETYYFPIYLYNLYQKLCLFNFNASFFYDKGEERKNKKLRDDFIRYRNMYDLSNLSYNFLPDLVNQKMRQALDIEKEINRMEERVEKIHSFIQEKQDGNTNKILTILSIISLSEVFLNFSEWFLDILKIPQQYHSNASMVFTVIILGIIFVVLLLFRRKN